MHAQPGMEIGVRSGLNEIIAMGRCQNAPQLKTTELSKLEQDVLTMKTTEHMLSP